MALNNKHTEKAYQLLDKEIKEVIVGDPVESQIEDNVTKSNATLDDLRRKDIANTLTTRRLLTLAFLCLLFCQNHKLFAYLNKVTDMGLILDLQGLMSILFTGTLLETYKVLQIIVQYVFSPTDYSPPHTKHNRRKKLQNN